MWQTKYAAVIPKNMGLGLNFRLCSEGYLLSKHGLISESQRCPITSLSSSLGGAFASASAHLSHFFWRFYAKVKKIPRLSHL